MKKTININISGSIFTIDDDAYEILKTYLDSVKDYFSHYPEHEEIVSDIENRIAEQLASKKSLSSKKVIIMADVEELIDSMGKVEDFGEAHSEEQERDSTPHSSAKAPKRLFRDPDNKLMFGVASGLGAYFDIDPVIIRIIFVIATITWGWGFIVYLVLWLVIPEARTATEKMQMHGKALSIASIEKKFKEEFENIREKEPRIRSRIQHFFDGIAVVINFIFKRFFLVLARVIIIFIGVGFSVAIAGLVFGTTTLLINYHSPHFDFPIQTIVKAPVYYLFVFGAFFSLLIPLLFVVLGLFRVGIGRKMHVLRKNAFIPLIALWIVMVSIVGSLVIRYLPETQTAVENMSLAQMGYPQVTQVYDLKGFTGIESSDRAHVFITQGKIFAVSATSSEDGLRNLELEVEDGVLKIDTNKDHKGCFLCFHRRTRINIEITMPELASLDAQDATQITSAEFAVDSIDIYAKDISRIELNAKAIKSVTVTAQDASRVTLQGNTPALAVTTSDVARLSAENLKANIVSIESRDASRAFINALASLTAKAYDVARIDYTGSPSVDKEVGDAARINPQYD
jgi:phage shock protein PspC (stress-responsive transcriptional regulator)